MPRPLSPRRSIMIAATWKICLLTGLRETSEGTLEGKMENRLLGRSGLFVSALSFGAMTFGGEGMFKMVGRTDESEAERLIALCFDAGVTLFDTADAYSNGRSEEILAHALGSKRQHAVIATKAWGRMGPGHNDI